MASGTRHGRIMRDIDSEDHAPLTQSDVKQEAGSPAPESHSTASPSTTSPLTTPPTSPILPPDFLIATHTSAASTPSLTGAQANIFLASPLIHPPLLNDISEDYFLDSGMNANEQAFGLNPRVEEIALLLNFQSGSFTPSTTQQTGAHSYSSTPIAKANTSLAAPPTQLPDFIDPLEPADMQSDTNERSFEFQAEIAKLRADSREAIRGEEHLSHGKATNMERGTAVANGTETTQVPTPSIYAAPGSGMDGEATAQTVDKRLASRKQDSNSRQNDFEKVPKEPSITDEIFAAIRKPIAKGNAAIIMDITDLTSTLLISHDRLSEAAPNLCRKPTDALESRPLISFVVLIEYLDLQGHSQIPTLSAVDPNMSYSEFMQKHDDPQKPRRAHDMAKEAKASVVVKNENADNDDNDIGKDEQVTDWQKGCETLFAIINGASQSRISKMLSDNKSPLRLQIEGTIAIAKRYNLLESLQTPLSLLLLDFVANKTLWSAIAERPSNWLVIGPTMRNLMVYEEALKHVCGLYPGCLDDMQAANVPDCIGAVIYRKSGELRNARLAVDQELLTLDLQPNRKALGRILEKKKSKIATLDEEMIEYNHSFVAFQIRALFRDYICDQIRGLESTADDGRAKHNHCVASFYDTIRSGGDAYLAADKVVDEWEHEYVPFDEGKIWDMLKRLKNKAAEIVTPLLRFTPQYGGKEELEYLTCVEVEESDVPWKKDEDVDMEDE